MTTLQSRLGEILRRMIAEEGPMSIERYMALCLGHRLHGYYMTRDPIGADGDFVTAPEISQMFGELIGLWAGTVWNMMGSPKTMHLIELGPGRGTLMADALRAATAIPAFLDAIQVHLVETSPVLARAQRRMLSSVTRKVAPADPRQPLWKRARQSGWQPLWHESIETLPEGPAVIIANEFLDALPIRQFQRRPQGWHERLVGIDKADRHLIFGLSPQPVDLPFLPSEARDGSIFEFSPQGLEIVGRLAGRIARQGGAALFIDYGHVTPGFGNTLQAMRRHSYEDALQEPGEADLTAHVDFSAMAAAARKAGAEVSGPFKQRDFLLQLGLTERKTALIAGATPDQAAKIEQDYARLIDPAPRGMGSLFKAIVFSQPEVMETGRT